MFGRKSKMIDDTLHRVFGAAHFRPGQEKCVRTLLAGRDVLGIFPTGAGKSLCFQLPAVLFAHPTVVVSPLISLMRDQTEGLMRKGIPAVCLDSMQTQAEIREKLQSIAEGCFSLVYVSPERLESEAFVQACRACVPAMLVVDEAHCVVQWGDSFRPAYRGIAGFVRALPVRPVVCAMTATADRRMQRQLAQDLAMRSARRVVLPVRRPSLHYGAAIVADKREALLKLCAGDEKTLIFCRTRERTEQAAAMLCKNGIDAGFYHAGMTGEERESVQKRFAQGQVRVLAATSAFGMGVDIPDVRLCIHDALPGSMTDLIQQSGRAGRDGKNARAVALVEARDIAWERKLLKTAMNKARGNRDAVRRVKDEAAEAERVLRWALSGRCLEQGIARRFGQRQKKCGACSACLRAKEMGRTAPLAQVPRLLEMSRASFRVWQIRWCVALVASRHGLDKHGISQADILRAAGSGVLRAPASWPEAADKALQEQLRAL